jgi:signal peptidase I
MSLGTREVFDGESGHQIWVQGDSNFPDSNVLLTISTSLGEKTALISGSTILHSDAKLFVEAPPERLKTPAAARFTQARLVLKWLGYFATITLLSFSALTFTGVAKARIVMTGSMAPSINVGDVIITTSPKFHPPHQGDVITYQARRFNGAPVAVISHRIIGGDAEKGFIVKGDRNKTPDVQRPTMRDVLGIVVLTIPFIGNLLTPKALFLIVPSIFGFWLILDSMKNAE